MSIELKLSEAELDAALAFIENSGASTVFPEQFEYQAIRESWTEFREAIAKVDLTNYPGYSPYTAFVPKQTYTVRPVQVLDPVDMLVYTGLTYRIAELAETRRFGNDIVFSNRFTSNAETGFTLQSDWDGFQEATTKKCDGGNYIGLTDVVDFFPRIYQHRLANAITDMTGLDLVAKHLERLLGAWSSGTSYGLPVGPLPSNYLSELTMHEVDEFLVSENINFVRYADDIAIFGNSYDSVLEHLQILGQRLHLSQGLSLNLKKTRIISCVELVEEIEAKKSESEERRDKLIDDVFGGDPYVFIVYEALPDELKQEMDELDLSDQFKAELSQTELEPRTINILLTLMASLRLADPLDDLLDNLPRLAASSEAVGRFLSEMSNAMGVDLIILGKRILEYVASNPQIRDHQSMWLLDPFVNIDKWNNLNELRRIRRNHRNTWVRQQAILGIGTSKSRSAILDVRYDFDDATPWESRAIVYACRNLPKDERQAFFDSVRPKGSWTAANSLMKAVVKHSATPTAP